jgi:hypothetical protein
LQFYFSFEDSFEVIGLASFESPEEGVSSSEASMNAATTYAKSTKLAEIAAPMPENEGDNSIFGRGINQQIVI